MNRKVFNPEKIGMKFCPECKGSGRNDRTVCSECGGFGFVKKKKSPVLSRKKFKLPPENEFMGY
jgi:DnaJ-class molecular chaperone